VNGTVFLISFWAYSLLVYRKNTDFCVLSLCPATLPKVFVRSRSFLEEYVRSFKYGIISSENKDNLIFCFSWACPSYHNLSYTSSFLLWLFLR
jgi:hypothetical protein